MSKLSQIVFLSDCISLFVLHDGKAGPEELQIFQASIAI